MQKEKSRNLYDPRSRVSRLGTQRGRFIFSAHAASLLPHQHRALDLVIGAYPPVRTHLKAS